jgi:hypothetical protein
MVLDETYNLPELKREPCPQCGSLGRFLHMDISEDITIREKLRLRHKVPGQKRPIAEIVSGDDLHRDSGAWVRLLRVIDRGKNWYKETITNSFGVMLHHQDHPLDKHTGHGSAKKKPEPPTHG